MPPYVYAVIAVGTILWFLPFVLTGFNVKAGQTAAQRIDKRARWGMLLELVAYSLLWQGNFWTRSPRDWQVAMLIAFLALANLLSWGGTRALGRQLRVDAAVGAEHELVRSGPYSLVRHPIYTSMLCVILGMGVVIAPPVLFAVSLALFLVGTEIRARIEDGLLAARFGAVFDEYRRHTSRYIPLVW